jgi:hypothetical protein
MTPVFKVRLQFDNEKNLIKLNIIGKMYFKIINLYKYATVAVTFSISVSS